MTLQDHALSRHCKGLPPGLLSNSIRVSVRPHLKAHRGRLLSGIHQPGKPVYAASFIRRRQIVLETQLFARPRKLKLILIHEIFHFVWARLGNNRRRDFSSLIAAELAAGARGELGESSLTAKHGELKNYICESFCDTAAWLYSGIKTSAEFTLASRWQTKRRKWFELNVSAQQITA